MQLSMILAISAMILAAACGQGKGSTYQEVDINGLPVDIRAEYLSQANQQALSKAQSTGTCGDELQTEIQDAQQSDLAASNACEFDRQLEQAIAALVTCETGNNYDDPNNYNYSCGTP